MPTGDRIDPYRAYNFTVQISDTTVAGFREVSGLSFNVDPVEYREGTDPTLSPRKLMGLRKYANIGLKRGFTDSTELWDWYARIIAGEAVRRDGSITLHDEERAPKLRWKFFEAWISKWDGPALNGTSNDVGVEAVELTVERVEFERV